MSVRSLHTVQEVIICRGSSISLSVSMHNLENNGTDFDDILYWKNYISACIGPAQIELRFILKSGNVQKNWYIT
jgi:hypothetical protein